MAVNGSFNTSYLGNFYCTGSWERVDTDVAGNRHKIKYKVVAHNTPGYYRTVYQKTLIINGSTVYHVEGSSSGVSYEDGDVMIEDTMWIDSSDIYGNGYISMSFAAGVGSYPGTNISGGDGPWHIDALPRGVDFTEHYISGRTSSSLKVKWNANHTVSNVYYSVNGGGWVETSGLEYTIPNRAANTQYGIRTKIIRASTGLECISGTIYGTTFPTTVAGIWLAGKSSTHIVVDSNCNVAVRSTRYRINWGAWQTSNAFYNLAPNTQYYLEVEKVASESGEAGYAGMYITTHQQTIASISLASKTSTSVTVNSSCNVAVSSTRYRIKVHNGNWGNWQTSNVFTGLSPATTYVVQVEKVASASGEAGYAEYWVDTYNTTIPSISLVGTTIKTITVTSSCNVEASSVRYRIRTENSDFGAWQSSPIFTNLVYNTAYLIQVEYIGTASGEAGYASVWATTLDIARITTYDNYWNVEESITFNITNSGNCVMRLYLLYNGVEIIYRNNITLTNGQYIFTLTTEEKNQLYSLAAGETNPDFKFVLRSYYDSVLVGSDSQKIVFIEFPTKAWTKIDGIWKRALVWGRPSADAPWRQCLPWVDINGNKDWKRI